MNDFLSNFLANILSDIIVGIFLVYLVNRLISKLNSPKLSIKAQDITTKSGLADSPSSTSTILCNFPPTQNSPAYADFQLEITNLGKKAATAWRIEIRFDKCSKENGSPLLRLSGLETSEPSVTYGKNRRRDWTQFAYQSHPTQIIYSGYHGYALEQLQLRVLLYEGYGQVFHKIVDELSDKEGYYIIYADSMEPQRGRIELTINASKPGHPTAKLEFGNE